MLNTIHGLSGGFVIHDKQSVIPGCTVWYFSAHQLVN